MTTSFGDSGPYDVAVIVPCRNAAATLREQLEALAAQDFSGSFEIIIADNGSQDATVDLAREFCAKCSIPIRIVDASRRRGASAARNDGIRATRSELVALCDADDKVQPGWLTALRDAITNADIVGGNAYRWMAHGELGASLTHNSAEIPFLGLLRFARTGNLCMRRIVFDKIGGFDEDQLAAEDMDFSWRAQLYGFRVAPAPAAIIYIRQRSTAMRTLLQWFRYGLYDVRVLRKFRHVLQFDRALREMNPNWQSIAAMAKLAIRVPRYRHELARLTGKKLGLLVGLIRFGIMDVSTKRIDIRDRST